MRILIRNFFSGMSLILSILSNFTNISMFISEIPGVSLEVKSEKKYPGSLDDLHEVVDHGADAILESLLVLFE